MHPMVETHGRASLRGRGKTTTFQLVYEGEIIRMHTYDGNDGMLP
jgi:hypothetical protein